MISHITAEKPGGFMKKILVAAVVGLMSTVGSVFAGSQLLNYVPAGVEGILSVKVNQVLNLPLLKEMRQENPEFKGQWNEFEAQLKSVGISISDLPSEAVVFFRKDQTLSGAILQTSIAEKKFQAILDKGQTGNVKNYKIETIGGKSVFVISKDGKDQNVAIFYVRPDVAIMAEPDQVKQILDGIKDNGNTVKNLLAGSGKINRDAVAWLVFKNSAPVKPQPPVQPTADGQPQAPQAPEQSIEQVGVSLDLTGKTKKDIVLDAEITCQNDNAASQMAMQSQMGLMMLTGMAFKDAPQLGADISKAISIKNTGKVLTAKVSLTETLSQQIRKYALEQQAKAKNKANALPAPVTAAPATDSSQI